MKHLLSFASFAVFLVLLPGCSDSQEPEAVAAAETPVPAASPLQPACELLMGWDPWEPYQFEAAGGNVAGLDISIARAVASRADCRLAFRQASWAELLEGIGVGDVDMVGGATRTAAREESAWFTSPYRSESFVIFATAGRAETCAEANSLRDLVAAGWRIGTVQDYYYGQRVAELQADPATAGQVVDSPVSETNLDLLLQGDIDAFIEDPFVAAAAIRARELGEQVVECDIDLGHGDVSFMLSRASVEPAAYENIEAALQALKESGELAALVARYRNTTSGDSAGH